MQKKISLLFFFTVCFVMQTSAASKSDSLRILVKSSSSEDKLKLLIELSSSFLQKDNDSAIHYANQSYLYAQEKKNIKYMAKSLSLKAESFQYKADFKEAINYYLQAINLAEKNNEKTTLGTSYNGLGIVYYHLNQLDKSEHYIQKAAAVKLELKDYTYYTVILTNLAALYYHKQEFKKAITILKSAEDVLINDKQEKYLASVYNSLGGNYQLGLSDFDSAEIFYRKSIDVSIKYDLVDNMVTGYHNLGELNYRKGNFSQAIAYLKMAEEPAKKSGNNHYRLMLFSTLSEVYEAGGDFKNALLYKKRHLELNNEIFQTEKQKSINELEVKYETEKKERQIQEEKQKSQEEKIRAEKERNKLLGWLFFIVVLFLIAVFIAFYFFQRKRNQQLLEKEKSRIFENIVHEIRTPLTLINGPLQEVKKEIQTNPQLSEYLNLIESNSEKLVKLVNELLDTSKLEKGKYQPAWQNGDLNLFFTEIIKSFKKEASIKGITIEYNFLGDAVQYKYAGNAIEKIFSNLLSNAIKYSKQGSNVIVNSKVADENLYIEISDNGDGIPEKEQKKVFERFYRLKEHESSKGTGIGLSLVKELVELLEGNIELVSKQGQGTTFTIILPMEKTEVVNEEFSEDDSRPVILLAEDDPEISDFVASLLKKEFRIIKAGNGEEAESLSQQFIPDIILTDIMMPVKDGLEFLQQVKSNALTDHIPVVIFSAKSSLESRLEGLKHGADAYIPKPFHPDELLLTIKNLYKTIQRNQEDYKKNIRSEETKFEDRLKSNNEFVNRLIDFIIKNIEDSDYSVNELSSDMCLSRSQLHRKLTTLTGFSATHFIRMVRLEKSKDLLKSNWGNVTEIAYACGFSSQSYFTKSFTEYFGESPSKLM